MTSIVVIKHSNAVHMLTDGGAWEADVMAFQTVKAIPIAHLNAVIACRGPAIIPALIAVEAGKVASTYEGLKAAMHRMTKAVHDTYLPLLEKCSHGSDFQVVVAGWSERKGPDIYRLESSGPAPWSVADAGPIVVGPHDDKIEAEMQRAFPRDKYPTPDALDPERDGLRIMELQHAAHAEHVGGKVTLTTVRREAITMRVIGEV